MSASPGVSDAAFLSATTNASGSLGSFAVAATTGQQTITPTALAATVMLANPDEGYESFYGPASSDPNVQAGTLPLTVAYQRFDWSRDRAGSRPVQLDAHRPGGGCRSGLRAEVRLPHYALRGWQRRADGLQYAGLAGFSFTLNGETTWMPDLNNAAVQAQVTKFIQAMGARYGSSPILILSTSVWSASGASSTIRLLAGAADPTTATFQWLVNTFKASFSCPLELNADAINTEPAGATPCRRAWAGGRTAGAIPARSAACSSQTVAAEPNQWEVAPVILEPV